ncbi:MAG TPA: penicillin acylase family protein, partial [Myxococcota bacterium]|nr:penicillin acylase family protein [Myxococcota bacterium]
RRGVPHVRARSERDAWFGLGFAHGQDRLGQLVWLRRLALGRTAEIAGEDAAAADSLARTLGFAGLAARDLARASADARAALEGYAAGVNAWLALLRDGQAAPPLGLQEPLAEIEPWQPRDSLAIAKHHAFALADPIAEILVLEQVVRALGAGPARALFPVGLRVPSASAPRAIAHTPSDGELAALTSLRRGLGLAGASVGSAGWVVAGEGTRRGRALLAADLHLAPTLPSRVYEAHLRGGSLEVAGATLPGIPAFWLGFNADVAWALVATPAVVVDLFEETLYADDPTRYFEQGKWRPLAQREERIAIDGGDERVVAVRETARGPLLDGLFPHAGRPLSVRWTGALGGGIDGLVALAHARDVAGAREALRAHEEPVADALLVDTRGGALQQLVGAAPRRAYPSGLQPVPSSNASYEWTARLALEEMPARALGPGTPWLIAADAPLAPAAGAIETLWRPGVRGEQLEAQLRAAAARGPATLAQQLALQVDHGSLDARRSVAAISALMQGQRGLGSAERALLDLLRDWDGASAPESRAAAAFHVLAARTLKPLLAPALGEELANAYLALPRVPAPALLGDTLARAAAGGDPELPWTAPDLARATLAKALRETTLVLSDRLGANAERWTWGRLHRVRFAPLWPGAWRGDVAALGPFELGGDGTTLAVSEYAALSESFDATVVSGYRLLVDAGNLDQALTAFAPGQSEHAGHPHATDAIERWQRGRASLLSTSDPVIEDGPVRELRLEAQ